VLVDLGRVGVPACLHIALQKQPRDTRLRFHVLDQRGPRGVKLQLLEFCPVSCSLVGPCDGDERQRQGKQREPEMMRLRTDDRGNQPPRRAIAWRWPRTPAGAGAVAGSLAGGDPYAANGTAGFRRNTETTTPPAAARLVTTPATMNQVESWLASSALAVDAAAACRS